MTEHNTVALRRLISGGQQGQFVVANGLQAGERVVTDGAQRLHDGATVQLLK